MPRRTASRLSSTLVLALASGMTATVAYAQQGEDPMNGETLLPVKKVTLYRSGVGAFERQGLVEGSKDVALRFETDQINDILKSMVLLDLDGGRVSAVGYGSQEPLERRLASFAIDLSGNPSVVSLLRQLRGASVTIETTDKAVNGVVLSTEERRVKDDAGADAGTEEFVTVMTDAGSIVSTRMSDVRSFRLRDEVLQEELTRALMALGESRADRTKSVELRFEGEPGRGRRIVVAYVTEMPVWKTSYRLVLDEGEDDPTVFGYAIVENTTDHDWDSVTLSLASGRPVSFTMDLYQPLFATRPNVPVPFLAGVAPRLYESAFNRAPSRASGGVSNGRAPASEAANDDAYLGGFEGEVVASFQTLDRLSEYLPSAQASAGFAGEQFMYTVDGPVTIERQRSAMLPILSSTIDGRRVSIYSPSVNPANPMRGVEITNDSGLHLMPGPIAVYDAGAYAGDAQIPHTSRNQTRLLSYSVDLPVRCKTDADVDSNVVSIRVNNGLLEQRNKNVRTTTYTIENGDDRKGRTLLIEHPRNQGWTLVSGGEPEELSNAYRFEMELDTGQTKELEVKEEYVFLNRYELVSYDEAQLRLYIRQGVASQAVLDAFRKAGNFSQRIASGEKRMSDINAALQEIDRDQRRLRDNIKTVREGSDLYSRYVEKLTDQEDRIEALNTELEAVTIEVRDLREERRVYLSNLNVN